MLHATVIVQSTVSPRRRNSERTLDTFRGKCPTMSVVPTFHLYSHSITIMSVASFPFVAQYFANSRLPYLCYICGGRVYNKFFKAPLQLDSLLQ